MRLSLSRSRVTSELSVTLITDSVSPHPPPSASAVTLSGPRARALARTHPQGPGRTSRPRRNRSDSPDAGPRCCIAWKTRYCQLNSTTDVRVTRPSSIARRQGTGNARAWRLGGAPGSSSVWRLWVQCAGSEREPLSPPLASQLSLSLSVSLSLPPLPRLSACAAGCAYESNE